MPIERGDHARGSGSVVVAADDGVIQFTMVAPIGLACVSGVGLLLSLCV